MEERRQYDRRKRTRRYDELTDRELLERYKHSVIPNDPYVLSIKLRRLFEYTTQVLVAVWIILILEESIIHHKVVNVTPNPSSMEIPPKYPQYI